MNDNDRFAIFALGLIFLVSFMFHRMSTDGMHVLGAFFYTAAYFCVFVFWMRKS